MNQTLVFLLSGIVVALAGCSSVPTFVATDLPSTVRVTDRGDWIVLEPTSTPARSTGLVFYPGGFVKPEAYERALSPIVAAGYPVVVVKMPLDLAFFATDRGLGARSSVPGVRRWVLGGHSLGGVAAALAVEKFPEAFAGLVFWASYPAESTNLSNRELPVLSVSASDDGLSTPAKVAAAAPNLPPTTVQVVIEGGIHAQFADYGPQKGDGVPRVSRQDQQDQVARATVAFLAQFD